MSFNRNSDWVLSNCRFASEDIELLIGQLRQAVLAAYGKPLDAGAEAHYRSQGSDAIKKQIAWLEANKAKLNSQLSPPTSPAETFVEETDLETDLDTYSLVMDDQTRVVCGYKDPDCQHVGMKAFSGQIEEKDPQLKGYFAIHVGNPDEWIPVMVRDDYCRGGNAYAYRIKCSESPEPFYQMEDFNVFDKGETPWSQIVFSKYEVIPPSLIELIGVVKNPKSAPDPYGGGYPGEEGENTEDQEEVIRASWVASNCHFAAEAVAKYWVSKPQVVYPFDDNKAWFSVDIDGKQSLFRTEEEANKCCLEHGFDPGGFDQVSRPIWVGKWRTTVNGEMRPFATKEKAQAVADPNARITDNGYEWLVMVNGHRLYFVTQEQAIKACLMTGANPETAPRPETTLERIERMNTEQVAKQQSISNEDFSSILDEITKDETGNVNTVASWAGSNCKFALNQQTVMASYSLGECDTFALALHRILGYPLAAVVQDDSEDGDGGYIVGHIFALADRVTGIDEKGIRPISRIVEGTLFNREGKTKVIPMTPEEAGLALTIEGPDESAIAKAIEYINLHRQLYAVRKASSWVRSNCRFASGEYEDIIAACDKAFPRAGTAVDGRIVREDIPNLDSIGASCNDYETLPGIREVPMTNFGSGGGYANYQENIRSQELAKQIAISNEINPLIVAIDQQGPGEPYILEGGHRFDALRLLGAKSFPALVVIDLDDANSTKEAWVGSIRKASSWVRSNCRFAALPQYGEGIAEISSLAKGLLDDGFPFVDAIKGAVERWAEKERLKYDWLIKIYERESLRLWPG